MDAEFNAQLKVIDQTILTPLVQRALGNDLIEVTDWSYRPMHGGAGDFATNLSGLYHFAGSGQGQGEAKPWSLVLKVLRSTAHGGDPEGGTRELRAYQSGLLDDLPGGLAAPRCFGIVEQPGEEVWLWLEEIRDEIGPHWPLARYGLAAHHFGRFNGAYLLELPLPSWPWLSRSWLRMWITQRAPEMIQLHNFLEHPLVARRFPADVADGTFRLWAERETFLTIFDHLPQTLCHFDAFRRNLFARFDNDGRDETVAIDWAFVGLGILGEELVPLTAGSIGFLEVELAQAQELDQIVFEGYLDGLREAGWRGDPQVVRFGYAAASALRYCFPIGLALLFDERGKTWLEQVFGLPIGELMDYWANFSRFLLNLADEARGLLGSLS